MFAGNFAPRSFAFCDGQLLAISQNDALFSLFGTIYGGDGRTTFGLPDLRGRIPIHMGTGPGLSPRTLGSKSGSENVTLTTNQIPSHGHALNASANAADTRNPAQQLPAVAGESAYTTSAANLVPMKSNAVSPAGGNQPHSNLQPFLCVNFIVALFGIYPSRN